MDRTTIETSYVLSDDTSPPIITSPGKFEGEALYVPYFWERFLNGDGDSEDNGTLVLSILPKDREQFPELGRRRFVRLIEDTDGCVCEV
jgi:hypothetical protein